MVDLCEGCEEHICPRHCVLRDALEARVDTLCRFLNQAHVRHAANEVWGAELVREVLKEAQEEMEETSNLSFQVLPMATPWGTRHLVVERFDGRDGITWDQLQAAKSEALGPDAVAIEVYPADADVVDEVNRRHLWEVPSELIEGITLRRGS